MTASTNNRKAEHLAIVRGDQDTDRNKCYFDRIQLRHRALPEVNLRDVDPSIELYGKQLSFPLLISSMTGGDNQTLRKINRNLAIAAEVTEVAMGVGSQRVMFSHPSARDSFAIRHNAPQALLFANLGAIQLNNGFGIEECREAVAAVEADALFLHLNPLQEAIQPEGDTNFAGLTARIGEIASDLDVPVVVKEVGAGLSRRDVEGLLDVGVHAVDVAGCGGTSWSRIEARRASDRRAQLGILFQDWGIPTPLAVQQLAGLDNLTLFASGGIRHGIDMVKAIALGASLCGMARNLIEPALESPDAVIEVIKGLRREFVTAMFLLGVQSIEDLINRPDLLDVPRDGWAD